ncbi:unannotated protein [freshwater metagenome]|uniref:Unannotated protein n=1 Tax=freshwater metagenome TaxID=449393 RepID=A0A6J7DKI8_9ZZZZ
MVGNGLICATTPFALTLGRASKVNVAAWPTWIFAASASENPACTRKALTFVRTMKPVTVPLVFEL